MSTEKVHPIDFLRSAADTDRGIQLSGGITSESFEDNGIPYRISDETPNSHGVVISNKGLDISSHSGEEGGPVLLEHGNFKGQGNIPIGTGRAYKTGSETHAIVRFDQEDPTAKRIGGLVKRRVMRGASISIRFSPEDIVEKDGEPPVLSKSQMFEFSAVGIGSNPNAMSLSQSLRSADSGSVEGLEGSMVALEDAANRLSILAAKLGIPQDKICGDISFLENFKIDAKAPAAVLVDQGRYADLSARVYLEEATQDEVSAEFLQLGISSPWISNPNAWAKALEFKGKEGSDVALSALGFGDIAKLVKASQDGVCPSCSLSKNIVRKADMEVAMSGAIETIRETFQKPGSLTYVGGKLEGDEN